jgi:hypothetical protein
MSVHLTFIHFLTPIAALGLFFGLFKARRLFRSCLRHPVTRGVPRGGGLKPPPKFRSFEEAEPKYVVLTYKK